MPEYEPDSTRDLGPDKTPINKYTVEISERDVAALKALKDRNGAGMYAGTHSENVAIWKLINQVCENSPLSLRLQVHEIEHPEWLV